VKRTTERILRCLQRFQPSLIRRVKLYARTRCFERWHTRRSQRCAEVWLKSGGSIVINQTEARCDRHHTGSRGQTAPRGHDREDNLDAIPEMCGRSPARSRRIIIIDFIDMTSARTQPRDGRLKGAEERQALSKILQFNDFGLVVLHASG